MPSLIVYNTSSSVDEWLEVVVEWWNGLCCRVGVIVDALLDAPIYYFWQFPPSLCLATKFHHLATCSCTRRCMSMQYVLYPLAYMYNAMLHTTRYPSTGPCHHGAAATRQVQPGHQAAPGAS